MPVRPVIRAGKHDDSCTMYYCTFTCYDWLPLFEMVNGYDMVYKWFDQLKNILEAEFNRGLLPVLQLLRASVLKPQTNVLLQILLPVE